MVLYQNHAPVILYGRKSCGHTTPSKIIEDISTRERMFELPDGKGETELVLSPD